MSEELQAQMDTSEFLEKEEYNVGDLVYVNSKSVYWKHLHAAPAIVVSIGPQNKYITIHIHGKDIAILAKWIEKRTMEDSCTE